MTRFIAITLVMFMIKWLCDTSKFRWHDSWFAKIELLNKWRNLRVPFDLWHMLMGLLYTGVAALELKRMGYGFWPAAWRLVVWWAVFFTAFSLLYHAPRRDWPALLWLRRIRK